MSDLTVVCFEDLPLQKSMHIYLLDLASAIRSIVGSINTIRDLASKILPSVLKQFTAIYIACDTYIDKGIKSGEREARGKSSGYMITNPDMKVPSGFVKFLQNGENKEMLFELMKRSIIEEREDLCDRTVYFSGISECTKISKDKVTEDVDLSCNHEEADTKLVALAAACSAEPGSTIIGRSPSGDIHILALFVGNELPSIRVLVDNGTGKNQKILDVTSSELSDKERKALLGLHAFSGND